MANTTFRIQHTHTYPTRTILVEDFNSRGVLTCDPLSWLYETEPAVDLPLQFNFGSPYRYLSSLWKMDILFSIIFPSSSLVVFFDFETKSNDLQEPRRIKTRDQKQRELGPSY